MTGAIFCEYLRQCLVPTLCPGDIVVMDNLPAHKNPAVRQIIEAAGAELRYLPPYSPDLNPIEQAIAKLKAHCARPRSARSTPCGSASADCSISSTPPNAPTSSSTPVMLGSERIPL
jgi:transposase